MTRIIAGMAGSLRLQVPKSGTRPTSDRVREAIFSSLTSWDALEGSRVLDLYAGSGALGLEAASRGATEVTLVEKHPPAAKVVNSNAKLVTHAINETHQGGRSEADTDQTPPVRIQIMRKSAQTFLDEQQPLAVWDVVLIDPPYEISEAALAKNLASLTTLVKDDAVIMVERSTRSPEPTWPAELHVLRQKRYGETMLWWAEKSLPEH